MQSQAQLLNRGVTAVAASVLALSLLGSRGLPAIEWAKQAAAGGVSIWVSDQLLGDKTNMAQYVYAPVSSGVVFSAINKLAYGSADPWTALFIGGAGIDLAASVINNPLSKALGI